MAKRTLKKVHPAFRDDIGDLVTRRPVPGPELDQVDPFLFLNHHGPQTYPPNNHGLPFGPHPHRGFETVTFILEGDLAHRDTGGHQSVIRAGGVQWMTAGSGLVHEEVSSADFQARGGPMEILQLWLNLPSHLKMTAPQYVGLQGAEIPSYAADDGKVTVHLSAGTWDGKPGAFQPLTDVHLMTLHFSAGGRIRLPAAAERNVFLYVIRGQVRVAGSPRTVDAFHLAALANDGDEVELEAVTDAVVLFGHAKPYDEPVVSYGPFVMNSREQIAEAIRDYQAGRFG